MARFADAANRQRFEQLLKDYQKLFRTTRQADEALATATSSS